MPKIDPRISLGNLIQIGVLLIAVASAYTLLKSQSVTAAKTLDDHEIRLRALERDVLSGLARIETRLIQIERGMH